MTYRFQTLETKQGFISQIMTSKNPVRVCEDVSQSEMEFAEVKALCAGNPLIREKMEIDIEVHKLQTLKSVYLNHLKTKLARQSELDRQLNLDNKENLLGKDNVKSFELETEADRQKLNSHNSTQKKNSQSYDLEI